MSTGSKALKQHGRVIVRADFLKHQAQEAQVEAI